MSEITLRKYHGLGNDYLIYDPNRNDDLLQERQIQALCKRNIGVGADGILYGPFFVGEEMWVRIFNPDYMRVDMGYPKFVAGEIPAVGFGEEIVNEAIFFGDNFYNATCVSMGNPNCVLMLEEVNKKKALHLGPYVENSRYFPNRINMQLCQVLDRNNIQIEIYERGAGYTFASGTGACAAAAASHRLGLVDERVTVHMHGGKLLIEFASDGRIDMTGPVVYIGSITLAEHFFA